HGEFLQEHQERDIIVGLASFPANGSDVEGLIEKAEEAVGRARSASTAKHVVAYEMATTTAPTPPPPPSVPPPVPQETARELPPPVEAKVPVSSPAPAPSLGIERSLEPIIVPETIAPPTMKSEARSNPTAAMSMEEAGRAADEAAARERERRASGTVMPRRLLLTVSDAARMTQINSLIRSAGYEARAAFDGQQALHLLRIESPDLLLLDYELQGIDGVETIRRLRKQNGGRLSLPVIMILSTENERARAEALELGAHSVHLTPYDPAELLASVRQAGSAE
ncbi:MAG TPA: response regulator, partial [Pyrinomonadaceae bacterium]|nr:response regulator [Pyrinomonadaceae bacterium]